MGRATTLVVATYVAALVSPARAFAADGSIVGKPLSLAVSAVGLFVAITLLVEALGVRKVALGGVIAEKMSYVILAIVCLACSAVAQWAQNFVDGVTLAQVQLASQLLVIAAMGLLAAYFYSVRTALQGYLKAMTGSERLAAERTTTETDEG